MQFKTAQKVQLELNWNEESWFYQVSSLPVRRIIERAFGLDGTTPARMSKAQSDVTLAMSIFAREIGADKSHVVHALLTGSLQHLMAALGRKPGNVFSEQSIREAWESSFREINVGRP